MNPFLKETIEHYASIGANTFCLARRVMLGTGHRIAYHFQTNLAVSLWTTSPSFFLLATIIYEIAAGSPNLARHLGEAGLTVLLFVVFVLRQMAAEIRKNPHRKYGSPEGNVETAGELMRLGKDVYVVDHEAIPLLDTALNPVDAVSDPYVPPLRVRPASIAVFWKRTKYRTTNDDKIRIRSELTAERLRTGAPIIVQKTNYFHGIMTNERFGEIVSVGEIVPGPLTRSQEIDFDALFFDGRRLKSIDESEASNHLGGSILAITSDDFLVYQRQGQGNEIEPSALAAAGSGSFDWRDYERNPKQSLRDLIVRSLERELAEELTVEVGPGKSTTTVLGFYRYFQRGGKIEFSAITKLQNSRHDIRVNPRDCGFTREVKFLHLPNPAPGVVGKNLGDFCKEMFQSPQASYSFKLTLFLYLKYLERSAAAPSA